MHNSWDKNDLKDAQVLLHLLKTGVTQHYHDQLVNQIHDFQELSLTYAQISLAHSSVLDRYPSRRGFRGRCDVPRCAR